MRNGRRTVSTTVALAVINGGGREKAGLERGREGGGAGGADGGGAAHPLRGRGRGVGQLLEDGRRPLPADWGGHDGLRCRRVVLGADDFSHQRCLHHIPCYSPCIHWRRSRLDLLLLSFSDSIDGEERPQWGRRGITDAGKNFAFKMKLITNEYLKAS